MKFGNEIKAHAARKAHALSMGGEAKIARRKAEGHLNARERIAHLLDEGSFHESGLFNTSMQPQDRDKTPADGKVAGFGKMDGRMVGIVSNDFTVKGASSSPVNSNKMEHVKQTAARNGFPVVFLGESTGARMPDIMGAKNIIGVNNDPRQYMRLRDNPWAAAVLGHSFGSATWYSAMADFTVIRKGACLAVSSPRLIAMATGQKVELEDLGGWRMHTDVTGLADLAVDTDAQALDAIRRYLGYLPSHANQRPPRASDVTAPDTDTMLDIIPESKNQVYDVHNVIDRVVDAGSRFDLKARFAKSLVTCLARVDGQTVGIIANNPIHKGGAIDAEACDKAISMLVQCDSYNIPLLFLVDQPGFLIGVEAERKRMPGKVMNWLNALALCTVPKLSVIMRKSYGLAVRNMGGSNNADEVAAWWTAEVSFMDPRSAVSVVHGVDAQSDPDAYARHLADMSRDTSAYDLGAVNGARAVIDPRETRDWLIRTLEVYNGDFTRGIGQHLLRNWPTGF